MSQKQFDIFKAVIVSIGMLAIIWVLVLIFGGW